MGGSGVSSPNSGSRFGMRIVSLAPDSPLTGQVTLYIDFLRGVNGIRNQDIDSPEVRQSIVKENDTAHMIVYNIVKDEERTLSVKIVWPDQSSPISRILGAGTVIESTDDSQNMILRVLNVYPGSPADEAGLSSQHDFVLFCLNTPYTDLDSFCGQITKLCRRKDVDSLSLKLVVYNIFHDETRMVSLKPSLDWDPQGSWIGCSFGDGIVDNLRNIQQVLKDRNDLLMKNAEVLGDQKEDEPEEDLVESPTVGKLSHRYPKKKKGKHYSTVSKNPHLPLIFQSGLTSIVIKSSAVLTEGIHVKIEGTPLEYKIRLSDLIKVDKDFNGVPVHIMTDQPESPMSPREGYQDDIPRPKKFTMVP